MLERIQKKCENLKVLVGDERSMFSRTTVGWMEHHPRYAVNRGASVNDLWGGIPVVVLMGDDVQEPPVSDTPVYIQDCRSAPSNHGRLVWTTFDSAVELTEIVRQTESERCVDVLKDLQYHTPANPLDTAVSWNNLCLTHGTELLGRMDEQGLFVFPTHHLEWERNKTKLLECNKNPNHPVARINSRQLTIAGMHRKLTVVRREGCYHYCIFAVTAKSFW